jgi:hypothetical protein
MDPNQNTPIYSSPQPITSPAAPPAAINPNGIWPGAFGIYRKSAQAVKFNLGAVLGTVLLGMVASALGNLENKDPSASLVVFSLVANIIAIIFAVALTHAAISSARFEKISFGTAVKKSLSFVTIKYFVACIAMFLLFFLSLLALIIPFFFVLPRLMLVFYYVVDKNMGPIESIQASWNATKGHVSKVYGVIGVSILVTIAIITVIGFYFYVMYAAAFALLYLFVSGQSWDNQPSEVPAPAQQPSVPQPLQAQAPVANPSTPAQSPPNTVVPQAQPQVAATPTTPAQPISQVQPDQIAQQEPNNQNNGPVVG